MRIRIILTLLLSLLVSATSFATALDSAAFNHLYEGGATITGYTAGGSSSVSSTNVDGNDILDFNFNAHGYYESTFWSEVNGGGGSNAFTIEWRQKISTAAGFGFGVYGPSTVNGSPYVGVGTTDFGKFGGPSFNSEDNTADFHVFRIAKGLSGPTKLWRDNVALDPTSTFSNFGNDPSPSNMYWGSGTNAADSTGQLDYFRVDTTGAYEPTNVVTPAVVNTTEFATRPALLPGSLIERGRVASQSPAATDNTGQGVPYGGANDGLIVSATNNIAHSVLYNNLNTVTYNLDLSTHPTGYTLDKFVATSGWIEETRIPQSYTLLYAKYNDLNTFYPIKTVTTPGGATANTYLQTEITNLGAINAGAIQFRVNSAPGGNATVFQELQLFDNSPPLTPPSITYLSSAAAPTLASGSLIEVGTVASQSPSADSPDFFGQPVGEANDGLLGPDTSSIANNATFTHAYEGTVGSTDLIYNLDLTSHPQGYTLGSFVATTGFVDHNRVAQDYTLSYAKVGALTDFIGLATVSSGAATQDWLQSTITNLNAENAGAIKVHISPAFGDEVIWQEFQLFEAGIPGDHDKDGKVDAADYVLWRSDEPAYEGNVGYDKWRQNFGNPPAATATSVGTSASVPEPSTLLLLILATVTLCQRRSRIT